METNGHTKNALGGLTGWNLFLAGQRLWERRALAALSKRFTSEELAFIAASGNAAQSLLEPYWQDQSDGVPVDTAINRLLKRVARWLEKHNKFEG